MSQDLLYERLADRMRRQIQRGVLRAGERLPSLRRLGRDQRISLATAVEAYQQLEREGLIEARPRSGYYVRAAAGAPPRGSRARHLARAPMPVSNPALLGVLDVQSRRDLIALHAATPDASMLPTAALAASVARAMRRDPHTALSYTVPQGLPQLRERIAQRYAQCGVEIDPDEVIVTAGAMEAISLTLRTITRPGDIVILESPTYHGLLQAVSAQGLRVLEIPNHPGRGIDPAQLRELLERHAVRAALLVPNFNNPLGSLTSEASKREIVAACAAHGTALIEDDLYGELAYSGERPSPLRRYDDGEHVVTCGSYSKMLAPGLRVGWMLGGRRRSELLRTKSFSTVATATLPQMALIDFFARHDMERGLRRLRRTLAGNAQIYRQALLDHWPDGTCVAEPAGGMTLWVELPPAIDGQALFEAAMARGIGILPGHLFSNRGDYAHHVRLSCGQPWDKKIETALKTVGELAKGLQG
ncbi:PLP-dependent aminotransferase family protein [Lysobacter gummosus]|uniref:PLP-dependent aminotransferase family protein n=1 Tax=Lysobacter gummosus TaxID=262324 RepID=A0ABY3XF60_9GAMM|nr:PLP-dependent aminotransferase family protein [Lysobacter gummosus]ALN89647.1 bacterial regulatory, gntR family protein [Lysobacter gummosus]UNP30273.1 PLP-dependent aminotransferase family protein [Lysobacter gummosus]